MSGDDGNCNLAGRFRTARCKAIAQENLERVAKMERRERRIRKRTGRELDVRRVWHADRKCQFSVHTNLSFIQQRSQLWPCAHSRKDLARRALGLNRMPRPATELCK